MRPPHDLKKLEFSWFSKKIIFKTWKNISKKFWFWVPLTVFNKCIKFLFSIYPHRWDFRLRKSRFSRFLDFCICSRDPLAPKKVNTMQISFRKYKRNGVGVRPLRRNRTVIETVTSQNAHHWFVDKFAWRLLLTGYAGVCQGWWNGSLVCTGTDARAMHKVCLRQKVKR